MVDDRYLGLRSFKSKRPSSPPSSPTRSARSAVATLYVVGEMKIAIQTRDALLRLDRIPPPIATGLVADAGHDLTISAMTEVNTKVLEFLGKTPAQADSSP